MKGLLPVYYNIMFASLIMDFEQLWNSGMRIKDAIDNGQLDKREGRISVVPRRFSEVQERHRIFKPTSMLFSRTSISINILSRTNIRMHIRICQGKVLNLRGISIHGKHPWPKFSNICAREAISSLWVQLHTWILSQRIGIRICIAIFTRRRDLVPMSVHDWSMRFKISLTMMSSQNLGLPISLMCIRIRCLTIRGHLLPTKLISSKYYKESGCS